MIKFPFLSSLTEIDSKLYAKARKRIVDFYENEIEYFDFNEQSDVAPLIFTSSSPQDPPYNSLSTYKKMRCIHLYLAEHYLPASLYVSPLADVDYDNYLAEEISLKMSSKSKHTARELFPKEFFGSMPATKKGFPAILPNEIYSTKTYPYIYEMDLTADLYFYLKYRKFENCEKENRWVTAEPDPKNPEHNTYFVRAGQSKKNSKRKVSRLEDRETNWRDKYYKITTAIANGSFLSPDIFKLQYNLNDALQFNNFCPSLQNLIWLKHAKSPWVLEEEEILNFKQLSERSDITKVLRSHCDHRYSLNRLVTYYPKEPTLEHMYLMEHISGINLARTIQNSCTTSISNSSDRALFIIFASHLTANLPQAFGRSYLVKNAIDILKRYSNNDREVIVGTLYKISNPPERVNYDEMRSLYFRLVFDLIFDQDISSLDDSTLDSFTNMIHNYFEVRYRDLDYKCLDLGNSVTQKTTSNPLKKTISKLFASSYRVLPINEKSKEDYLFRFIEKNIIYNMAGRSLIPDKFTDFSAAEEKQIKMVPALLFEKDYEEYDEYY